jgi:DNA primase large subunit
LPEWVKALITYLEQTGELCHYGRMAVAGWMLWCGFTDEEIHEVFKHARNYKPHTTQYQINYIRESMLEDGIKPMRCETVVRECNQNKAPNLDCTHR